MKAKGYLLAGLSAITYGAIPLFAIPIKQTDFSFDAALFYRFLLSTLIIGLYLGYKKVSFRIDRKELGFLVLLGLMYSFSAEFLFMGYDYMPAGVASTILFLYPVLVALIMGFGYKEKISGLVWVAIMLAFMGVGALHGGGEDSISPIGVFIVFLSALTYAVYMVIVNKSRLRNMEGIKVSFYSMLFCMIFFLVKSIVRGGLQPIPSVEIGINLVLFAVVATVVSLIALVIAINLIGSTPTAIIGSLEPLTAVTISVVIFHEPFTQGLILGITLIISAVLLTILSGNLEKIKIKQKFSYLLRKKKAA